MVGITFQEIFGSLMRNELTRITVRYAVTS